MYYLSWLKLIFFFQVYNDFCGEQERGNPEFGGESAMVSIPSITIKTRLEYNYRRQTAPTIFQFSNFLVVSRFQDKRT